MPFISAKGSKRTHEDPGVPFGTWRFLRTSFGTWTQVPECLWVPESAFNALHFRQRIQKGPTRTLECLQCPSFPPKDPKGPTRTLECLQCPSFPPKDPEGTTRILEVYTWRCLLVLEGSWECLVVPHIGLLDSWKKIPHLALKLHAALRG